MNPAVLVRGSAMKLSQFFVEERAEFFGREHEGIFRFKGKD